MVDTFGIVMVSLMFGFPLMWCLIEVAWPWFRNRNAQPTGYNLPPLQQQTTVGYGIPFPQQQQPTFTDPETARLMANVTDPAIIAWANGPKRVAEGYYAHRPDGSAYWVTTKWPDGSV
jgi:hypothetical protein